MNIITAKDVNFYYGDFHAIKGVSIEIEKNTVTAFIGPSGCGKSTFLRLINRMNDLIDGSRLTGEITVEGENIYRKGINVDMLRAKVGMVFHLRVAHSRGAGQSLYRRNGRELVTRSRFVGRGKRQVEKVGFRTLGRTAAAFVYSPCIGRKTAHNTHGRTRICTRPPLNL